MDIEEFEKRQQPRAKRSRLEPFQAQIFELKAKGYANWQVCQWLEANGLKVSQEAVRKFIKSRDGSAPAPASMPGANTAPASAAPEAQSAPPAAPEAGEVSPSDDTDGLTLEQVRQRREANAKQFIKNRNPLLKHVKKEPSK